MKILGLEILIIFFFTLNGAYVTLTSPSNSFLMYAGLFPLALALYIYLMKTGKWVYYFSAEKLKPIKETFFFCLPLLVILALLLIGNDGLDSSSIYTIFLVLATQIMVVAFIEEIVFRGLMLNILVAKGFKVAVITTSLLFALTHSLQLLDGQSIGDTIFQVSYAFFIGAVLSLLVLNKKSIIIAILFHGLNNAFIILAQNNGSSIYNYLIIAILIVYAVFLWSRALQNEEERMRPG